MNITGWELENYRRHLSELRSAHARLRDAPPGTEAVHAAVAMQAGEMVARDLEDVIARVEMAAKRGQGPGWGG